MSWVDTYKQKRLSVKEAAAKIESGDRVYASPCTATPVQLLEALADRVNELEDVHVISGLLMHPFKILQSPEYVGRINYHTIFYGPYERAFFKAGNVNINSVHFSKAHLALQHYHKVNVMIADVSAPDDEGYLYYGPLGVAVNKGAREVAEKIIVQVNKLQPKVDGIHHRIHVSEVDWLCEHDHPLPALAQDPPTEVDNRIADFIVPMIPDGSTIQIGLGSVSDAVGLKLADKKDLSVHTEMFTDSMLALYKKGVINGSMVSGFILGSQELHEFAAEGKIKLKPLSITNDPREIAKIDKLMSINVTLMVDLTGQACSESVGFQQYSATGGQGDFTRGAAFSKGGKSFLCLPSTVKTKDGRIRSTIMSALPPGAAITTPRSDVMYVVTEYGVADLFCKPIVERVNALIAIAHPDFRDALRKEAIEAGLIRAQ